MCCTLEEAQISNTVIYAGDTRHPTEGLVHVIGYQNRISSEGVNAMLLPFPAEGKVGRQNLVNGQAFKDILTAYGDAVERLRPQMLGDDMLRSAFDDDQPIGCAAASSFEVFESGSYTIFLADNVGSLGLALKEDTRYRDQLKIPYRFLLSLKEMYPNWPMALCCFEGRMDAPEPLFWWYHPRHPNLLFAPAIDAHDGNPPKLGQIVHRQHTLAFASHEGREIDPTLDYAIVNTVPTDHRWMFSARVCGTVLDMPTQNGDFVCDMSYVRDPNQDPWIDSSQSLRSVHPPFQNEAAWGRVFESRAV